MKKVFLLIALTLSFLSCSNDDNEKESPINFKTVKVIVTRTSSNISLFEGGTILTIPLDLLNSKYNIDDFDQVLENDGKVMLTKLNNPLSTKQEFTLKQKNVNIQILDTPQLLDEFDLETDSFDLETKIEILVDGQIIKSQTFIFDANNTNMNLIQYSE